jgi:hypothetical protein
MSFAAPLFLLALFAGIIPVLVHLIHRQKATELPFATLRFLKVSVQRTRRRKYLDDVSLLAVRIAALALIAFGLAKPAVTSLGVFGGRGQSKAVVIVLDNSGSMALLDAGRPRFETGKRAAEQVLDALHDGDSVALLPTGGPPAPEHGKLYHSHETVRQALAQCQVTGARADLAGKLQVARSLLAESEAPNREIYVITDNQALSWDGLRQPGAAGEEGSGDTTSKEVPVVLIVDVNRDPVPNVALRSIEVHSPAPVAGVPARAVVEVFNTSVIPQQTHVELHLDGVKEAVSPTLSLPPGAKLKHEFRFTVGQAGVHRGEVRLSGRPGDDRSALYNRLFFALAADQHIPVALVKPRRHEIAYEEDTFYLEQALSPADGGAIRARALTPEELAADSATPLSDYTVIFCVNLPALDGPAAGRLRDYVRSGGHLFWICGPNVEPEAYNRMNAQARGELLPAPLGALRDLTADKADSSRVGFLDRDHPALAPLCEPASLYQSVLVHKHFTLMGTPQSEGRLLARLDDGQPVLVERSVGHGSVLFLGTGVHAAWTNLPLRPIFLPLFARLTFHLAGAQAGRSQVVTGAPLIVALPAHAESAEAGAAQFEVVRPSGETLRVQGEPNTSAFRYVDTHELGIYLLRQVGVKQSRPYAFAVNPDPDESDPTTLTRDELKSLFGRQPIVFCDDPEDVAGTVRRLREGKGLWDWFLAAVLVGLVFEVFLANRVGTACLGAS